MVHKAIYILQFGWRLRWKYCKNMLCKNYRSWINLKKITWVRFWWIRFRKLWVPKKLQILSLQDFAKEFFNTSNWLFCNELLLKIELSENYLLIVHSASMKKIRALHKLKHFVSNYFAKVDFTEYSQLTCMGMGANMFNCFQIKDFLSKKNILNFFLKVFIITTPCSDVWW